MEGAMTEEQMVGHVKDWKKRLSLEHWDLSLEFKDLHEELDRDADITFADDHDNADMRIHTGFNKWDEDYAQWVVVHELMHLVMRDLHQSTGLIMTQLPKTARKIANALFLHELEGVVDRTSMALVSLHVGHQVQNSRVPNDS